jgi:hypothetical protein
MRTRDRCRIFGQAGSAGDVVDDGNAPGNGQLRRDRRILYYRVHDRICTWGSPYGVAHMHCSGESIIEKGDWTRRGHRLRAIPQWLTRSEESWRVGYIRDVDPCEEEGRLEPGPVPKGGGGRPYQRD